MPSVDIPACFGYLEEDLKEDDTNELSVDIARYEIFEGRELRIGRDPKSCNVIETDLTVSNRHLQVYSIAYTADDHHYILVYAKDLSTNGTYWRYKHGNHWKEMLIGRGNAVLLSDGDKVRLCNDSSFTFRSSPQVSQCSKDVSIVHEEDTQAGLCSRTYSGSQTEKWDLELSERSGWRSMISVNVKWPVRSSGWVDHLKPGRERSVFPHISGEKGPAQRNKDYERSLWREVDLLRNISHPNVLHVERVFFSNKNLYIISDLVTGGDLMSYIERPGTDIHDAEACFIVYQVLKALEYVHRQGICHRDLKPENILMSTPGPGARIVLADFGHSKKLSGGTRACTQRMKTFDVGTNFYVAPEVRGRLKNSKGYTMAADLWSVGIITALLLTGQSVFEDSGSDCHSSAAYLDAVAQCDLAKMGQSQLWQSVNNLAKDFVQNLITLDEKARLNVGQALEHGWFTEGKRKEDIKQKFAAATKGWMRTEPILDFQEDLALYREASELPSDSILMPPPPPPKSNMSQRHPLQNYKDGQQCPYFSQTTEDGATNIAAQAGQERQLDSENESSTPSTFLKQAGSATKRQHKDSTDKTNVRSETTKPTKSRGAQFLGEANETVSIFGSSQRKRSSTDLEYEERILHDRVSREEASIFRSAKSYGQSVEKRRRLED